MTRIAPVPLAWPPTDVALAASLLACDPLALGEEAMSFARAGIDWLHVDIMDNHFVPNFGIAPATAAQLVARQPLPVDAHLMVKEPLALIEPLAQAGVSIITVHAEGQAHIGRTLGRIRAAGVRAGLALSPETPISVLEELFGLIDMVLVMSVYPGFSHQSFLPSSLSKLERTYALIERIAPDVVLAVDGGITANLAQKVCQKGARVIVAGSALSERKTRKAQTEALRRGAQKGLDQFYQDCDAKKRGMEGGPNR